MDSPRIDADRLWAHQNAMDKVGATPRGGVHRLALNEDDIRAHRMLADRALARGWSLALDPIGNMFLTRSGTAPLPPVCAGSHTDSQPMGGRFDGMSGVLAAIEALETIDDAGIVTRHPLEVAVWNNEEGPRFAPACMGSSVYVGARDLDEMLAVCDPDGVSMGECVAALSRAIPEAQSRALGSPMAAFLESHIEQGIELETHGAVIGIVEGMQGYRRWSVDVRGQDGHSGTLPMSRRRDAFVTASRIAITLQDAVTDADDELRFTIGRFEVKPGGVSVIPGHVHFTIDVRHPSNDRVAAVGRMIEDICNDHDGDCTVDTAPFGDSASMTFPADMRAHLAAAADQRGFPHRPIYSRAGHDARYLAQLCPAGMMFIPCRDGISHNEAETAEKSHCAAAAQVTADVMLALAHVE